ncbi:MAG: FlgD immunoglobulin-like domain containing protein [Calditrichia bacterium]
MLAKSLNSQKFSGVLMWFLTALILLLLNQAAHAYNLTEDVARQIEVQLPQEKAEFTYTDAREAAVQASPAWSAFKSAHPDWKWMWWEPGHQAPQRAYGSAIPVPGFNSVDENNIEQAARAALGIVDELAAVPDNELKLARTFHIKNYWMVTFVQEHNGMKVYWSEVELRISDSGNLIAFGLDNAPGLSIKNPGEARNTTALLESAQQGLPQEARTTVSPQISGPFILPLNNDGQMSYRVVYRVETDDASLDYPWIAFVDAENHQLLKRELAVDAQMISGTVSGEVHPSVLVTPVSVNFLLQDIDITSLPSSTTGTETSDASGAFSHMLTAGSTSGILNSALDGPVIQISNLAGSDANYTNFETGPFPAVHNIAWTSSNSTITERDAFYHTNVVFEHVADIDDALGASPDFRSNFSKLSCTVNNSGTCNAFYSRSLHQLKFYQPFSSCINTGEIPMVIYHEWGHSRHYEENEIAGAVWSPSPSQLKEAVADITSCYFAEKNQLPHPDGVSVLRDVNNTYRYPDDYAALGTAHDQSQILSGALWKMRSNLIASYGASAGKELAEQLFHIAQYGGASHTSSIGAWVEFLLDVIIADDDDLNLGNGTPNFNDISTAFQDHGIWPTNLGVGPDPADAHAQVVLVLDRSGSMGWESPTRMSRAQTAANAFLGLMGDVDRAGISNFSDVHLPMFDHSLVPLNSFNRSSLSSLIGSFTVGGATNIGLGLEHGQIILNPGMGVPGAPPEQFILLLSDGEHNSPTPDPSPVFAELSALPASTRVYTIFLSNSSAGETLMQDLAAARDGVFLNAPNSAELLQTYIDMYALIMQRDLILSYTELVNPAPEGAMDSTITSKFVVIDPSTSDAQFMGIWEAQGPIIGEVEVIDPSGNSIKPSNVGSYPGASLINLQNGQNIRVIEPMPGQWTIKAKVLNSLNQERVKLNAFCLINSDISLSLSQKRVNTGQNEWLTVLQARLADDGNNYMPEPILNASVVAFGDNGLQIPLYDDGQHFDEKKDDGIYGSDVAVGDSIGVNYDVQASFVANGLQNIRKAKASILATPRTTSMTLKQNWNLVSLPVTPPDSSLNGLFPGAQQAYEYIPNQGYNAVSRLSTRRGFWVRMNQQKSFLLTGTPVTEYSMPLAKGWNIIGGLNSVNAMPTTSPANAIQVMYSYSPQSGYMLTNSVKPGEGVWVKALRNCQVMMDQSGFSRTAAAPEALWTMIIKAEGQPLEGAAYGSRAVIGMAGTAVALPAPPDAPRYTTQVRLVSENPEEGPLYQELKSGSEESPVWSLEVQPNGNLGAQASGGTILSWTADDLPEGNWTLRSGKDGSGEVIIADMRETTRLEIEGNETQYFSISRSTTAGIGDEVSSIPVEFALHQNYPNPFNPSTRIQFDIPQNNMQVRLHIYNILGQQVAELVNDYKSAGSYTVTWDGRNAQGQAMPSGLYIARMEAGDFHQSIKLMLMK